MAASFIILGSVVPGVVEELVFRGYFQQRLLQRYSTGVAIGVSSFLFALYHGEPIYILAILPIGLWLGLLAWKLDGIVPGIICHAVNNAIAFSAYAVSGGLPSDASPIWGVIDALLMVCLVVAVVLLLRGHPTQKVQTAD